MLKLKFHGGKNTAMASYFYRSVELLVLAFFSFIALIRLVGLLVKAKTIYRFDSQPSREIPLISIIICAHNEEENLKQLIPLLLRQKYERFEVIIALDRCTDQSEIIVGEFEGIQKILIDEIPENFNPKKHALETAINKASGEWLLLTDADCRPGEYWINQMSVGMGAENEIALGLSPYFAAPGMLNALIQYETYLTSLEFSYQAVNGKAYMGLGRNMAYRKATFNQINGFKGIQSLTGGDDDLLVQRMMKPNNCTMVLEPQSWVNSIPKKTWPTYLKQKTRHFSVGKFYTKKSKNQEAFRWTTQFLFWTFFTASILLNPLISLVICIVSFLIMGICLNIVANRLAKRFNILWLPFVDLIYSVGLPLVSLRSMVIKNIKWN